MKNNNNYEELWIPVLIKELPKFKEEKKEQTHQKINNYLSKIGLEDIKLPDELPKESKWTKAKEIKFDPKLAGIISPIFKEIDLKYAFAKREQVERKRRLSIGKRKGLGLQIQLEEAVSALPHIDHKISQRLLKHFGSFRGIVTANREDFFEIRGVGEKIASDIIDFIYTDYNELSAEKELSGIKEELDSLRPEPQQESKKSKNEENQQENE